MLDESTYRIAEKAATPERSDAALRASASGSRPRPAADGRLRDDRRGGDLHAVHRQLPQQLAADRRRRRLHGGAGLRAAPPSMPEALAPSVSSTASAPRPSCSRLKDTRRLLAVSDMPPRVDEIYDLRSPIALGRDRGGLQRARRRRRAASCASVATPPWAAAFWRSRSTRRRCGTAMCAYSSRHPAAVADDLAIVAILARSPRSTCWCCGRCAG